MGMDVEKYRSSVTYLVNTLGRSLPSDVREDLVQDALIRAWSRYPSWRGRAFTVWLSRLTRRVVYDRIRSMKYHQSLGEGLASPEDVHETVARRILVEDICAAAPEDLNCQIAIWGAVMGDESPELAERYGTSVGAVKHRTYHGRSRIRGVVGTKYPAGVLE